MQASSHDGLNETLTTAVQSDTVKEVEDIVKTFVDTLNSKNLEEKDPKFAELIDPKFTAIAVPPFKFTLEQYISHLNVLIKKFPEYQVMIKKLDTQITSASHATVFLDFQITGVPIGVVRNSVAMLRFRKAKDGKWKWLEYQATDGFEEDGLSGPP